MTQAEYEARAVPRLAVIDRLDALCKWELFDWQCDHVTRTRRELRERLMREQTADEVAAGL